MTSSDAFARAVSIVLSPLLMPTYVVLLVLVDLGSGFMEIASTVGIVFLCSFAIPLADVILMIRRGKTTTVDVPNRQARTEAFVTALISGSIAILLIRWIGFRGEPLVHVILVAYVINIMLAMGINLMWKISVHMLVMAGSIAILLVAAGLTGASSPILRQPTLLPLFALLVIVGWARLRLKAHSPSQVIVGAVLGFCGHWLAMLAQVAG